MLSNGAIENETLELAEEYSEASLSAAAAHLQRHMVGHVLGEVDGIPETGSPELDELLTAVKDATRRTTAYGEAVFVGGAATMASAFDAVEVVRQVLNTLEQQFVVVTLVRDVLDRGLSVAIGNEHGVEPLSTCSVVVAPVRVEGEHLGTIGVLGPTRMNYPQALAAVEVVSDRLGKRLAEG